MRKSEKDSKTGKNLSVPDYEEYEFSRKEMAEAVIIPGVMIVFLAILCYNNILFSILLIPYIPFYVKERRKSCVRKEAGCLTCSSGI